MSVKRPSVGIVGLGLIGGSIGLALRNPNREVLGCDLFPQSEKVAVDRFCVDRIATLDEVSQCDVVFIGVPPGYVIEVSHQVMDRALPSTVVTDCSSVKLEVSRWAAKEKLRQFVPGHPMAGHEKSGSAFASAWLFKSARWILTPTSSTTRLAVKTVQSLTTEMGATTVRLEPEEHDRHIALLSHLPHVLAASLVLAAEGLPHWEVAAGSWKDLTRVGGVDPKLWSQIFHGNREELGKVVEQFQTSLAEFSEMLASEDREPLESWLAESKRAKEIQSPAPVLTPSRSIRKKKY